MAEKDEHDKLISKITNTKKLNRKLVEGFFYADYRIMQQSNPQMQTIKNDTNSSEMIEYFSRQSWIFHVLFEKVEKSKHLFKDKKKWASDQKIFQTKFMAYDRAIEFLENDNQHEKNMKWKTTLIIMLSLIVTIIFVLITINTLYKPLSETELKEVALRYATARCYSEIKNESADDKFCNNLKVTIGEKQEDFAAVVWSVIVRRLDTNEIYSSFMINSNNGNLAVDEATYVLNDIN